MQKCVTILLSVRFSERHNKQHMVQFLLSGSKKMEGEVGKWEDETVVKCLSGRPVWDERSILIWVKGR